MSKDISESFSVVLENEKGLRADKYISDHLELFTRSQIKNRAVRVLLDNKEIKLSKILFSGDSITVEYNNPEALNIVPEKMDLNILYEDFNSIVINKPQFMVVHPGAGNYTSTLVHGLLYHCIEMKGSFLNEDIRPGIVHRLDKDTSGVIIAAKNPDTLEFLSSQFRNKSTKKSYLAIIKGVPARPEGVIETNIARDPYNRKKFAVSENRGKYALSRYKLIESWGNFSLVLLGLDTGRTHQLRVHMLHLGNSILGDPIYGRKSGMFPDIGLMLHAYVLSIKLPRTQGLIENTERTFKAPVPSRFIEIFDKYSKSTENTLSLIEKALD
jgi:23S rRNA pseudouridine1911/1915/1917 synthase